MQFGTVSRFDEAVGLGILVGDDHQPYEFHCIEIADGSRTIDIGQLVAFIGLPRFGRVQAGQIHKR